MHNNVKKKKSSTTGTETISIPTLLLKDYR